jgi:hypothetical protein
MTTFPASTRQALIEKAKAIDPAFDPSTRKGSYSSVGWSNRAGTVLTPAAIPGVYTADRPFYWNNIDVGCRMTVIELSSGQKDKPDLWVHSPVGLDGPLQEALAQLGTVKHVVSPNYEHLKFARQWAKTYPDANMWGCPGLSERMPEIDWAGEMPFFCRPPDWPGSVSRAPAQCWDWSEIQPLHIDCEVNPVTNKPFFNECVYYHTPSKTLMVTDLYWNYPKGDGVTNSNYENVRGKEEDLGVWELAPAIENVPIGSRLWKNGMDRLYRPVYLNLMVKSDKQPELKAIAKFLIDGWDVETVIPAHGDIIRGKDFIQGVFRDFFNL